MNGIPVEQLREMIGLAVRYEGMECCVIEVLEDGPALVLQHRSSDLQTSQFGEPRRRVPETRTVPVLAADGAGLHGEFLALELLDWECR